MNPQLSLPFPQRPNQFPTQPLPNPNNNKNSQFVYNMEVQNFQTYITNPLDLNNVQLRSGRILERNSLLVVIQESEKEKISEEEKYFNENEKTKK